MPSRQPRPTDDHDASFPAHERAAEEVRHRRLELGWTQDHLAERAGLSAATVRKVEAAAQPHYRDLTCTRLCAALGWAPDALDALRAEQRRANVEAGHLLTTSSSASTSAASAPPTPSATGRPPDTGGVRRTMAPDVPGDPDATGATAAGAPSEAEVAALSRRIARLDARRWERLLAFVDGLTAIDR